MRRNWIFLVVFFVSKVLLANDVRGLTAQEKAFVEKWGNSKEWRARLHYRSASISRPHSEIDGPGFFFAENGNVDSVAELEASLRAMKDDSLRLGRHKAPTKCAFPSRHQFFASRGLEYQKNIECKMMKDFIADFHNPTSVSVVFSSAHANNPASMFGHTFLKFNSDEVSELKHIGINFAAQVPPDENPVAFGYFGVMGGYYGLWSTTTYHERIKTYNQGENRDLWEYVLTLSPEEAVLLIKQVWEIEVNSHFDYYFFDDNCAYQILRVIEAIRPDWNITDHTIYVIPGESVKNLTNQPGVVREVKHKPSVRRRVKARVGQLTDQQREQFFTAIDLDQDNIQFGAEVVDAALDYYQFVDIKTKGQMSTQERDRQLALLSYRAQLGKVIEKPIEASETRPDLGHDSYAIHLSGSYREGFQPYGSGSSVQLRVKSAYHDLLNSDVGYTPFAHIDFPQIELQYDGDLDQFRVNELDLLQVTSLLPVDYLSSAGSWKLDVGVYTPKDFGTLDVRASRVDFGYGYSVGLGPKSLLYALLTAKAELYHGFDRGYRYGPGFELGGLTGINNDAKLYLRYKEFIALDRRMNGQRIQQVLFEQSVFLHRNWEVRNTFEFVSRIGSSSLDYVENRLGVIYFLN